MEFKLKDGWYWYFLSGVCVGVFFIITLSIYALGEHFDLPYLELFSAIIFLLFLSVLSFIAASEVKKA